MAQKHQPNCDSVSDKKKRRRVGFSAIDAGIKANDCIQVYLVSSKEEVGASDSFRITPVDLSDHFNEDGMIYGYDGLKITVWISMISFHSYADITYQSTSEGKKGITDLKSALQRIFAETLVENKEDFLQTFSVENNFTRSILSSGEILPHQVSNGHNGSSNNLLREATSELKIVRMKMGDLAGGQLYSRLVPLVLLLISGSNPIDVLDPCWELYVVVQDRTGAQGDSLCRIMGFAALYRFYRYPIDTRLRLGQILVPPPYQRKGYGAYLIEMLYNVAVSEDVYDFTVEEPVSELQHVRTTVDVRRLHDFEPIQDSVNAAVSCLKLGKLSKKNENEVPHLFLPPASAIEDARKFLKITRKQFLQCWEVLIYLRLDPLDKCMEDFVTIVANRVKSSILGKDSVKGRQLVVVPSDYDPDMSFVIFRSQGSDGGGSNSNIPKVENQPDQEELLQQMVDKRVNEIQAIAKKVVQPTVDGL